MSYTVKHTDPNSNTPITVNDQQINQETSLTFVGKNFSGYAPYIAENFLHLLENFSGPFAPGTQIGQAPPTVGQLWFDTKINLLKIWDGELWMPAGSVKKSSSTPTIESSTTGDVWVDTTNHQLYIFSGSNWLLVGPQFSEGLKTGPVIDIIIDTSNISHSVICFYASNYLLVIISKETFVPKTTVSGFPIIKHGVNLSNIDSDSTSTPVKFWGTASQANALVINGVTVDSTKFVRTDYITPLTVPLKINSNDGISIGGDSSFSLITNENSSVLYSKSSGKNIDFNLANSSDIITAMRVTSSAKVGIGLNNINPQEALDVNGNITTNGNINVTTTDDLSIVTYGGISVEKTARFNSAINSNGTLYVNSLDSFGEVSPAAVILPGTDTATSSYDIGSESRKFRNVYADSFVGNFSGTVTGTLIGNASGSASKLASPTVFSLTGDISSAGISFNGQTSTGTAIFQTSVTTSIITSKPQVPVAYSDDKLLIYRSGTVSPGLKQVSKLDFLSNIPLVPIGAIFPFAGVVVPSGYKLCDGSEVRISEYSALYEVIGTTYNRISALNGANTFCLPDLRGRFALGMDNMDNNITVPSIDNPDIFVDAGGGSANRVSSVVADTLGSSAGSETKTLLVENLPEHKHNLNSGEAQYYASGIPDGMDDDNARPGYGMPSSSTGFGLGNSGNVISSRIGTSFDIMNPYLAINYIIFTGVL